MKPLLNVLLFLILFSSCAIRPPITEVPVRTTERIEERLVPVYIPADSSTIQALFECDSLNRVVLKELREEKTKAMQTKFDFNNGKLNYKAEAERDTVYLPSKTIYTKVEVPFRVEVPVIEYRLKWYFKILSWIGGISLLLLALWGALKIKKP